MTRRVYFSKNYFETQHPEEKQIQPGVSPAWALIRRGNQNPGKRPSTKMAFIAEFRSKGKDQGHYYRCYIWSLNFDCYSKTLQPVQIKDCFQIWYYKPNQQEIDAAKDALGVLPKLIPAITQG